MGEIDVEEGYYTVEFNLTDNFGGSAVYETIVNVVKEVDLSTFVFEEVIEPITETNVTDGNATQSN